MKLLSFLDQYSFLFSLAYTLSVAIIGFFASKIVPALKKYKVKKCLSLGKYDCKIVLPEYKGTLHNPDDILSYCPIGDVQAASNVIDLIHFTGLYSHQQSIIYDGKYFDSFECYNIFCVGGLLANPYTFDLFKQFFPNFKICASEEKIRTNPNKISQYYFVVSEKKGFCWGDRSDERFLVEPDERYAIIVKLSNHDFNMETHGTVHILFGNGIEGTIAISKYLLNEYQDLYKKVKGKPHYFIAFKIKRYTGIIIPNSFVDLTEEMFHKD